MKFAFHILHAGVPSTQCLSSLIRLKSISYISTFLKKNYCKLTWESRKVWLYHDGRMDGRMDRRADKLTDGRKNGLMDGRMKNNKSQWKTNVKFLKWPLWTRRSCSKYIS